MCTYWHSLDRSWVSAKSLAPSPAAEEIFPSTCHLRRNLPGLPTAELSDPTRPSPPTDRGAGLSHFPVAALGSPKLSRGVAVAVAEARWAGGVCCTAARTRPWTHIPAFFFKKNDFLATRRNAGAAPILLVVKVPQHFLGSSGSVEKSGFYFADHYQKQRNGCFCLKSKVTAGCSGAQAAARASTVSVLGCTGTGTIAEKGPGEEGA